MKHSWLTPARAGGNHPPMSFLEWPSNCWADCVEIWHSLWGVVCATFVKKKNGSFQVTDYDVIRGTASDRFFKEMVFSTA